MCPYAIYDTTCERTISLLMARGQHAAQDEIEAGMVGADAAAGAAYYFGGWSAAVGDLMARPGKLSYRLILSGRRLYRFSFLMLMILRYHHCFSPEPTPHATTTLHLRSCPRR